MYRHTNYVVQFVAVLCALATPATSEDFYKGKTITLFVGYASGGGYDTYARMFARHYSKQISGHPNITIKNQPGAGSIMLANYLFNSAPKDGTELGAVGREIPTATVLKAPNAKFKSADFAWIGSLSSGKKFCVSWHDSPIRTYKDLFEKEFIVGGSTGESPTLQTPRVLNNLFGLKLKVIAGYTGGSAMFLAMERGEIHGRCPVTISSLQAGRSDWISGKKVNFLLEVSLSKDRTYPDVPIVTELAKSEADLRKLELFLSPEEWQRPITAPPGTEPARLSGLRKAFDSTMGAAAYIADVERQQFEGGPMSGLEMVQRIGKLESMSPELLAEAIAAARGE